MNAGSYETVISDSSCVINGELNQIRKSGEGNQRFCAVWKNYFLCYKDKEEIKPQVAFSLEGFQVEVRNTDSEEFSFELSKPGVVTHIFKVDSEDNFKQWLLKLQEITTELTPKEPISQEIEANVVVQTNVKTPDEENETSTSFSFPAVDIEQDKLINLNCSSELHTSLSFDSAAIATENNNETTGILLHRSDEVEDLSKIVEDSDKSSVESIELRIKKKSENQQKEKTEDAIENDDDEIYDSSTDEQKIESEHDKFFSDIKTRAKSLSEEVFLALGMIDEIEVGTGIEETIEEAIESPIKSPDNLEFNSENATEQSVKTNVSVQGLKETFYAENKQSQQEQGKKEKVESQSVTVDKSLSPSQIKGFVNVMGKSTSEWKNMWAELKNDHLELKSSPSDSDKQIIPITNLQLQPSVWDTSRLLAFKLLRNNSVEAVIEPKDVQDFGRWVSGIFHCIQHPRNQQDVANTFASSFDHTEAKRNDSKAEMKGEEGIDLVSVKEMRAIFESTKDINSPPSSINSSPSPIFDIRHQLTSTPTDDMSTRNVTPQDFESNFEKMKVKLQPNYADVVCWLGRYIEQDEEKQVLSSMANPFLAKLRLRHKLEMIAQIEEATVSLKENIQILKEKLLQKEDAKREVGARKNSTGLIKSAEDAKRAGNESKRMDKDCVDLQTQIHQAENQLEEMKNATSQIQHEIEMAYEQFNWGQENGHKSDPNTERVDKMPQPMSKLMMPGWTKNTKEKGTQNIGNNAK